MSVAPAWRILPIPRPAALRAGPALLWDAARAHLSSASAAAVADEAPPVPKARASVLSRVRNVGVAAHVDSGKTTVTERILYYTGRIKAIHEVRGKDGVGAKMDFMELEREKGITIQSAATAATWNDHNLNIIDTPGHIDFTVEVERALRVLDGAVLVLCGVSGVQSQSLTVDRQMKRYNVPRIIFVNKLDRAGADAFRTIDQIRAKLGASCAAVQVPIGAESDLSGLIDVISRDSIFFDGPSGETVRREPTIPREYADVVEKVRKLLVDTVADVDEAFGDLYLMDEDAITTDDLRSAIRRATIARKFSPVFMGSALKNTGVQTMLDGAVDYLPDPTQRINTAFRRVPMNASDAAAAAISAADSGTDAVDYIEEPIVLTCDPMASLVSLAFKLEEGRFGQLTYLRVYQGTLRRGDFVVNARTGKKMKVPRLVQMHGGDMEDITEAAAGDICAMFGLECASGDTFVSAQSIGGVAAEKLTMESLYVPEPVMSLAIEPLKKDAANTNFAKGLNRFCREDPTFRVSLDPESRQTVISGMGELHLDVYVQRMAREYGVELTVGAPRVNYRETIQDKAHFNYIHKKQSGGSGQYAGVIGYIEPTEDKKATEFKNAMIGNNIPPGFFAAIQKGFNEAVSEGALSGHIVQGVRMVITDGKTHPVDSNELAFRMAAIQGFRQAFEKAIPTVLEPVMSVEAQVPSEFQGTVMGAISKRRGIISNTTAQGEFVSIEAEVPLGEMFGYSTELRSVTQGKGEYSMEYKEHRPAPGHEIKRLTDEFTAKKAAGR
jgi:elongation factor G